MDAWEGPGEVRLEPDAGANDQEHSLACRDGDSQGRAAQLKPQLPALLASTRRR